MNISYSLNSSRQKVHHKRNHDFLLFWFRLGNHDRCRHQGAITHNLTSILTEQAVLLQEVAEYSCRDSLVSVVEGVIFHDEVEKVGCY